MYANEQLGPSFYVLVRYSLLFSSEIILKQLFASGSVNIVERLLDISQICCVGRIKSEKIMMIFATSSGLFWQTVFPSRQESQQYAYAINPSLDNLLENYCWRFHMACATEITA